MDDSDRETNHLEGLPRLPARLNGGHKGDYGRVVVAGGSRGMSGALALTGLAAIRSGAGLVAACVPASIQPTVAAFAPTIMVEPLPEDADGRISPGPARRALTKRLEWADVVAVGPGLGQSASLTRMIDRWIVESTDRPLVLDADGLNALAHSELLPESFGPRPLIMTPHPGEFARLTGKPVSTDPSTRLRDAEAYANRTSNLVVVLKGSGTVVTDGRRSFVNTTGNPGMATGGTGDVLTGIIAALLGQGLAPFEAARLAVHVHGCAGDRVAKRSSRIGLIATDLIDELPTIWPEFSDGQ